MSYVVSVFHAAGAILDRVGAALPEGFCLIGTPDELATVAALRTLVEEASPDMSHFVLAAGTAAQSDIAAADWRRTVSIPLRRAFGLATGAARRFRAAGQGTIVIVLPSSALLPGDPPSAESVLLRATLGMGEALRAELGGTGVDVGIVFHDPDPGEADDLALRLAERLAGGAMYSLSPRLTAERIDTYFATMLAEVDRADAGAPLPDIGPMAAVYDLLAIGAPALLPDA